MSAYTLGRGLFHALCVAKGLQTRDILLNTPDSTLVRICTHVPCVASSLHRSVILSGMRRFMEYSLKV
jgi:hypothetical protein